MDTIYSTNRKFKRMFVNILSIFVILAIVFPGTTVAAALEPCSHPLGCVTIGPGESIHVAYALALSGASSSLGIDERNGIEIAIDDSGGKILGHDIQLTGEDEACSAEGGATAGANLAADPTIVAVIGTSCSVAAREAMPLLSAVGFVMVSPSNTGPDLTEPGNPNNYPGYLRVSWNDKVQGAVAAHFAREYLGISTAATIIDESPYSGFLQQAFADEFTNLGGTITAQETIDPGQIDMSEVLGNIASGSPELIYFPVFLPAGGYIIDQARDTEGLETTYLLGSDGLYTPDVVTAAGADVEGFMVTNPGFSQFSPGYFNHFLPAYFAKFGYDPISVFHAHAYDAFMMIKAAIEKVAVVDQDGTIQIGRQALRDALYGTVNFPGLTGNLTCSATGDCADPHIAVYKYHADRFPPEYLWPLFPPPGWQQVNVSGFGDPLTRGISALDIFRGQLYAGASNWDTGGQIWRLGTDGQWSQVTNAGFSSGPANPAIVDLSVFQGQLYAGAGWNIDAPGQVWRSPDGTNWQSVTTDGFGNIENIAVTNFVVFKRMLYAGTGSVNGSAQIWRSKTGNSGSWTQVAPDGPGLTGNVTGFAVYKGVLYAAIEPAGGLGAPIQVWRSTNGSDWTTVTADGFGDERNESTGGFAQFGGYLYLGTRNEETGAQLWRTRDGMHWEQVVGDGFGDLNNIKIESLLVYNDLLYAATYNWMGLQLWRSVDGMNWEQVSANGFGDSNNFATLWNNATVEYQGKILIGTWNYADGGELWMFTP